MKIEICNTLSLLPKSSELGFQTREAMWQERIVTPFKPLLQMLHMDFTQWGRAILARLQMRPRLLWMLL